MPLQWIEPLPPRAAQRISESTFVLACNGTSGAPPASAVREFLVAHGARRVTTIYHPLEREDEPRHVITVYERGQPPRERALELVSRPPLTYAFDPFIPLWPDGVDCWIGFNNLAVARGLLQRRLGRAGAVGYWAIDFVPDRFGPGILTRAYDLLDAFCCRRADARFEVSPAALEGRNARHGLRPGTDAAPAEVAPMGAWLDRAPVAPEDGWRARRVVYLGHLVPRQGVGVLLDALAFLARRGVEFKAEIAGRGPLEQELTAQAVAAGLEGRVRFLGFIADHRELEAFVASGSVGVAPYDTTAFSFTRFADPSKIRAYMAGGLPVITTDVPPNASELAAEGGAEIVPFQAEAVAAAIERALSSPHEWRRRREAALAYARRFDWETIVGRALERLGFVD